jgi:hypothetical protein
MRKKEFVICVLAITAMGATTTAVCIFLGEDIMTTIILGIATVFITGLGIFGLTWTYGK